MGAACADPPTKVATLFSDNSLTAIRLSDADTTNLQVLHTEQARILPPFYEPLLALSSDASRLAYVTASDESMDDAHLEYLEVASPNQAIELASIPQGFWNVRPAWSPDNKQLAFLRLNTQSAAQGQTVLELWIAEVGGQAHKVNIPTDLLRPDDFTANPALPLCWAADNKTVIFTNVARESKAADQGTRQYGQCRIGDASDRGAGNRHARRRARHPRARHPRERAADRGGCHDRRAARCRPARPTAAGRRRRGSPYPGSAERRQLHPGRLQPERPPLE